MAIESYNDGFIQLLYNEMQENDEINVTVSFEAFKKKYVEDSNGRDILTGVIKKHGILGLNSAEDEEIQSFIINTKEEPVTEDATEEPVEQPLPDAEENIVEVPDKSLDELKTEAGQDGIPSDFGLYNMAENVNEWNNTTDFRPTYGDTETAKSDEAIPDMPTGGVEPLEKKPETSDAQKLFDSLPAETFKVEPSKAYLKSVAEEQKKIDAAKKKETDIRTNLPEVLDTEIDALEKKLISLKEKDTKSVITDEKEKSEFDNFLATNPDMQEYIAEMKSREGEDYDILSSGYDWVGMWRAGKVPKKTDRVDSFGRPIWDMPNEGVYGQQLMPLKVDKEYYLNEWNRLNKTPLTVALTLDNVKDEDKDAYIESTVKHLQVQEALILSAMNNQSMTAGDLIRTNLDLTPQQIEYNETVLKLNDSYTALAHADKQWFRDYLAYYGKTPIEANITEAEAKQALRFVYEEYMPTPNEIALSERWQNDYQKLSEEDKEKVNLQQLIDYQQIQEDAFEKEYKNVFGTDIEKEWEEFKTELTTPNTDVLSKMGKFLFQTDEEEAEQELLFKKDPATIERYREDFYNQGRYKMRMRLLEIRGVSALVDKANSTKEVLGRNFNRNGLTGLDSDSLTYEDYFKNLDTFKNLSPNKKETTEILGVSEDDWMLMDMNQLEETVVPVLRKQDGGAANYLVYVEAVQKLQNDIKQKKTNSFLSSSMLLAMAEKNGINMYNPQSLEAVNRMKNQVAQTQVAYGLEHLSDYQKKIASKVEEYGKLQKKASIDAVTTDDLLKIEQLRKEINTLRDNPLDLYNPVTGEWVSMTNKDFKGKQETLKYEREVNEQAHILRKKNNTDSLIDLWENSAAQLKYWEELGDKKGVRKYRYTITRGGRDEYGALPAESKTYIKELSPLELKQASLSFMGKPNQFQVQNSNGQWVDLDDKVLENADRLYRRKKEARRLFDVYNRALFLNEDPAGIKTWTGSVVREGVGGFINDFGEKMAEGFINEIETDSDFAVVLLNGLEQEGVELNSLQKEIIEEDISTMTSSALGSSIQPMVSIIGTSIILSPIGGAVNSMRAMRVAKVVMTRKWGRAGKFMYYTMKGGLKGSMTFGLAPSEMLSWQMGAGEGMAQELVTNLNVGKKLSGKWGKVLVPVVRVLSGATAETIAEYSGEFTDQLSKTGFDWEAAFDRTFGANVDEGLKKLYTTAIVSLSFSSAFNIANGKRIRNLISGSKQGKTEVGQQLLNDIDQQIKNAEEALDANKGLNDTEVKSIEVLDNQIEEQKKEIAKQDAILDPNNPVQDGVPAIVQLNAENAKKVAADRIAEIESKKTKILEKAAERANTEATTEETVDESVETTVEETTTEETTTDETTEVQAKQDDVEVSTKGEPTIGTNTETSVETKTRLDNFVEEKTKKPKDRTRLKDSKSYRQEQKSIQREVAQIITGKGSQEKISKEEADVLSSKLNIDLNRNKDGGASMTEVINKTVGKPESEITTEQFLEAAQQTRNEISQKSQQQEKIDQQERLNQFKQNAENAKKLQEEANKAEKLAREGKFEEADKIIKKVKQESSSLPSDVGGLGGINQKISTVENLLSPTETTTETTIEETVEPTQEAVQESVEETTQELSEVAKTDISEDVNSLVDNAYEGKQKNGKNKSIKAWWSKLKSGLDTKNEASALKAWRQAKQKLNEILDKDSNLTPEQKALRNSLAKEMNNLLNKSNFDLTTDEVQNKGALEGISTTEKVLKLKPEIKEEVNKTKQDQKLKNRQYKGDVKINKKKAPEGVKVGDEIEVDGETILVTRIVKQGKGEAVVGVKPVAYKGKNTIGQDIAKGRKARAKGYENTTNNYLRQSDGTYADINGNPPPADATPIYDVNMTPEESQDLKDFREVDEKNRKGVDLPFYNKTYKPKAKDIKTETKPKPKKKTEKPKKKDTRVEKNVKTEKQVESESKKLVNEPIMSLPIKNTLDNEIAPETQMEIAQALGIELNADLTLSQAMEQEGMFENQQVAEETMNKVNEILKKDAKSMEEVVETVEEHTQEINEEVKKTEEKVNDNVKKLEEARDKKVKKFTPEQKKRAGILADLLSKSNHPWAESIDGDFTNSIGKLIDMMNNVMDGKITWDEYIQEFKSKYSRKGANSKSILDTKADKASQEAAKELMNLLSVGNFNINQARKINEEIAATQEELIGAKGMITKGQKMMAESLKDAQSSLGMSIFGSPSAWKFMAGLVLTTTGRIRLAASAGISYAKTIPSKTLQLIKDFGITPIKKLNPFALNMPIVLGAKAYSAGVVRQVANIVNGGLELMYKLAGKVLWNPLTKKSYQLLGKAFKAMIEKVSRKKARDGEMRYTVEGKKSFNETLRQALQGKNSKEIIEVLKFYRNYYNNAASNGLSTQAVEASSIGRALSNLINTIDALDVKNYRQIKKMLNDQVDSKQNVNLYEQAFLKQSNPNMGKLSDYIKSKVIGLLVGSGKNVNNTLAEYKMQSDKISDTMKEKLTENERIALTFIMEGQFKVNENSPLTKKQQEAINKILADYKAKKKTNVGEYLKSEDGKVYQDFYKNTLAAMQEEGLLGEDYIAENYVPHFFKLKNSAKGANKLFKKDTSDSAKSVLKTKHSKKRVIPSYNDAMAQGFMPLTLDAAQITQLYSKNISNAIAMKGLIDGLFEIVDGRGNPIITTNQGIAKKLGYTKIENTSFSKRVFAGKKSDGGILTKAGDLYVHPDILSQGWIGKKGLLAGLLGNTTNDFLDAPIISAIENLNNLMKRTALSFSFFHHLALTETLMATEGAFTKGVQKGGNPFVLFTEILSNFQGKKTMGVTTENKVIYENMLMFQDAIAHGLKVEAAPDAAREMNDAFVDKMSNYLKSKGLPNVFNPAKGYGKFSKSMDAFLWDYMHNNYKLVAYETLLNKALKRVDKIANEKNMSPAEVSKLISDMKKTVASQVNDTFGGQNWVQLNMSPATLRMFQMMFLSPDWTVSTVRQALSPIAGYSNSEIFRAAKLAAAKSNSPYAQKLVDMLSFFDVNKKMSSKEANAFKRKMGVNFWVNAGMKYYLMLNVLNLISSVLGRDEDEDEVTEIGKETIGGAINDITDTFGTRKITLPNGLEFELDFRKGKWMWENDIGRRGKVFIGYGLDGRKRYLTVGKQFNEGFELYENAFRKIGSKLSPMAQVGFQTFTGSTAGGFQTFDMGREETTGTGIERFILASAKSFIPFSAQTQMQSVFKENYANYEKDGTGWYKMFYNVSKGMSKTEYREKSESAMKEQDYRMLTRVFMEANDNNLDVQYERMFDDIIEFHKKEYMKENNPDPKNKLFRDVFITNKEFAEGYVESLNEEALPFLFDVLELSVGGNESENLDGLAPALGLQRYMKDLFEGAKSEYPQSEAQLENARVDLTKYILTKVTN